MTDPTANGDDRAARELDHQIDLVLAGGWVADAPGAVHRLAVALRPEPPPTLAARVAADRRRLARRRLGPVRVLAAFMAYLFLSHGIGNIVNSAWVARNVGEPDSPHFASEGGLALIAVGLVVALAAWRPRWLPAAVIAGVPLGMAFGAFGVGEVGEFAAGAALHLTQLAVAVALGVTSWRNRRYIRALGHEEGA